MTLFRRSSNSQPKNSGGWWYCCWPPGQWTNEHWIPTECISAQAEEIPDDGLYASAIDNIPLRKPKAPSGPPPPPPTYATPQPMPSGSSAPPLPSAPKPDLEYLEPVACKEEAADQASEPSQDVYAAVLDDNPLKQPQAAKAVYQAQVLDSPAIPPLVAERTSSGKARPTGPPPPPPSGAHGKARPSGPPPPPPAADASESDNLYTSPSPSRTSSAQPGSREPPPLPNRGESLQARPAAPPPAPPPGSADSGDYYAVVQDDNPGKAPPSKTACMVAVPAPNPPVDPNGYCAVLDDSAGTVPKNRPNSQTTETDDIYYAVANDSLLENAPPPLLPKKTDSNPALPPRRYNRGWYRLRPYRLTSMCRQRCPCIAKPRSSEAEGVCRVR